MGEWLGGVYLAAAAAPQAAGDTISGLSLAGIIAAVAAVFAAISAWAAWRAASAARDRVEHQKAATLYDIIVAEYLDRDFELTENKETIGGKHPRNLREAKNRSLREYYRDPEQWREVSKYDRGIWERDEFRRQETPWRLRYPWLWSDLVQPCSSGMCRSEPSWQLPQTKFSRTGFCATRGLRATEPIRRRRVPKGSHFIGDTLSGLSCWLPYG